MQLFEGENVQPFEKVEMDHFTCMLTITGELFGPWTSWSLCRVIAVASLETI